MRRFGLGLWVLVASVGVASAQTPAGGVAQAGVKPPPNSGAFFGAPLDQKFDAVELLKQAPAAPKLKPDAPAGTTPGALGPAGVIVGPPPAPPPPPKVWTGGAEFGLNGSSGNSDLLNMRFGSNFKRDYEHNLFVGDLLYVYTNQQRKVTKDQALLNLRDEQFLNGTPYSLFTAGQLEYDRLRAYDFRVGVYTGVGYQFWKTDRGTLRGRIGAGAVREIGGDDVRNRWVPEAVLGGDFTARIDERQALVTSADAYPNLSHLGQYRVRVRAAYEILVDPTHNLILRFGLQDRYDSAPGPAKRNDVDYFTSLMFRF